LTAGTAASPGVGGEVVGCRGHAAKFNGAVPAGLKSSPGPINYPSRAPRRTTSDDRRRPQGKPRLPDRVRQLLDLVIHSLYSNKEIFLRELVSNASDAADKLRFEALTDDALYEGEGDLKIRVSCDKAARTVTVRDNGIGMSRQEVVDNIGTIARSGTKEFFRPSRGSGEGQPAHRPVRRRLLLGLHRRRPGHAHHPARGPRAEHGVRWESGGEGTTPSRPSSARSAARRSSCTCGPTRTSSWTAGGCAGSCASSRTTSRCRS